MDHIPESVDSADGDDDKVYLFFSEKAMEYDFYSKLTVSRVARVCKVCQHRQPLLSQVCSHGHVSLLFHNSSRVFI